MKSIKSYMENCNGEEISKSITIRKKFKNSDKFGKSERRSEKLRKFGKFRLIRTIWQPWFWIKTHEGQKMAVFSSRLESPIVIENTPTFLGFFVLFLYI